MGVSRRLAACTLLAALLALQSSATAWGLLELKFVTAPALPSLPAVTLNGRSQTLNSTMTSFSVEDTRLTKSGWNLTAQGQSGSGMSPVFARYCPKAKCAGDLEGYVAGGQTLAAGSLALNSTGAAFTGGLATAPTLQCAIACALDGASPTKIASDASGLLAGEGTWTASGFSSTSLALTVPTTLRSLPSEEIYRVNILWTLATGP